jgi:hypothetical protein
LKAIKLSVHKLNMIITRAVCAGPNKLSVSPMSQVLQGPEEQLSLNEFCKGIIKCLFSQASSSP